MRQYTPLKASDDEDEPGARTEGGASRGPPAKEPESELSALLDPENPEELDESDRIAILEAIAVQREQPAPLRDDRLAHLCSDVLDAVQLDCLARMFGLVAGPRRVHAGGGGTLEAAVAAVSLCELRALFRLMGCEGAAGEVLHDLHQLQRWLQGHTTRRPALSMLHDLELLSALPEATSPIKPEPEPEPEPEPGVHAPVVELSMILDDFIRLMSRGKLRRYIPGRNFLPALQTLRQLSVMFGSLAGGEATESSGPQVQSRIRMIDRRGLALACTQAGAVLTEFEKQQLWGILANADNNQAATGDDGSTRGHSGWVVRGGEVRRLRRWMTLEPSRGRLLFMEC